MIIDKEYPATHSMSTSWFAVDCEGNVALLEFNENGPVPTIVQDECFESIIIDRFIDKSNKMKRTVLTEEQVNLLVSCLEFKPFDNNVEPIFLFDSIWRINTQLIDEFNEIIAGKEDEVLVLSEKEGLYHVGYIYDRGGAENLEWECMMEYLSGQEQKFFEKLCQKNFLLSYTEFGLLPSIEGGGYGEQVWLPKALENFPIFIYAQEYINPALKRIHIPKCPLKAGQLTEECMELALKIPVSFRDSEQFQVQFYYPSSWLGGQEWKPYDSRYCRLEISKGNKPFVRTGCLAVHHNTEYTNYHYFDSHNYDFHSQAYTFEPTVAIIKDEAGSIFNKLPEYIFMYAFELHYMERNEYLQQLIDYYRPYLLVVTDGVLSKLKNEFRIDDKKISFGDEELPIYTSEEVAQRKDEILALAKKPYRGKKDPIILEKKEV